MAVLRHIAYYRTIKPEFRITSARESVVRSLSSALSQAVKANIDFIGREINRRSVISSARLRSDPLSARRRNACWFQNPPALYSLTFQMLDSEFRISSLTSKINSPSSSSFDSGEENFARKQILYYTKSYLRGERGEEKNIESSYIFAKFSPRNSGTLTNSS